MGAFVCIEVEFAEVVFILNVIEDTSQFDDGITGWKMLMYSYKNPRQ